MDVLKLRAPIVFLILCCAFILSGCQISYYFKSAYNQIDLLNRRVPLEKALKDPHLSDEEKRKLLLADKAHQFAQENMQLKTTNNYTSFVKLDRPYVTYVVSASPKWELKHHQWHFLFVGDMPYKGFFDEADAIEEEQSLKEKNLDTYRRGVSAYSTLGWFNDPLLSSMLTYSDQDLVNTVIHETVHATLYIKNSADFNERMAVFLGNKGAELFYEKEEGQDSKTKQQIELENEDDRLFSKFISREIKALEEWYKTQPGQTEGLRQDRLKQIQTHFTVELAPFLKTKSHSQFAKIELNNARLMLYKTYLQDLSDFEALYKKVRGNIAEFLRYCRQLEKHPHPEQGLKELISAQ